jgi:hypothetical protein
MIVRPGTYYSVLSFNKNEFYNYYKDDINTLFTQLISDLKSEGILIKSIEQLHDGFIDYVYKYTINNKPRI